MQPLKIAHVAPVATAIPPLKSGSVQTMTALLTEGLVARGHQWVQVGTDYVLVAIATGLIANLILNN